MTLKIGPYTEAAPRPPKEKFQFDRCFNTNKHDTKRGQEVSPKINNQIYIESRRDITTTTSSGRLALKIAKMSKPWYIYVHEVCGEHSPDNSRWL